MCSVKISIKYFNMLGGRTMGEIFPSIYFHMFAKCFLMSMCYFYSGKINFILNNIYDSGQYLLDTSLFYFRKRIMKYVI